MSYASRGKTLWKNGTMDPGLERCLRLAKPALFEDDTDAAEYRIRIRRVVATRQLVGRHPGARSSDPTEASDGMWYQNQRLYRNGIAAWKRAILDEEDPGWDDVAERPNRNWRPGLDRHSELVRSLNRPPKYDLTNPAETAAYQWYYQQQRRLPIDDPRRDEIAAVTPGWDRNNGFADPHT